MAKNKIINFSFFLLFLIIPFNVFHADQAHENEEIIYGPETFVRNSGDPVNLINEFNSSFLCENSTLCIINGDGSADLERG